ncbi:hypothetical protein [Streptomyces aquilus]|uniref:hypothetical protein n=1 Tax=Streptomyces aquilus TaxID=2548456 RepID=UPI001416F113|nr:hypothetical protein [Streptomyces aquilus]
MPSGARSVLAARPVSATASSPSAVPGAPRRQTGLLPAERLGEQQHRHTGVEADDGDADAGDIANIEKPSAAEARLVNSTCGRVVVRRPPSRIPAARC